MLNEKNEIMDKKTPIKVSFSLGCVELFCITLNPFVLFVFTMQKLLCSKQRKNCLAAD